MLTISHRVRLADPNAHLLEIETSFRAKEGSLPKPFVVFMPVWTPGSYLVREYARHVEGFAAKADDVKARARKLRKNAWCIEHDGAREISVRYRLYCNDLTVRTNHVDSTHAYFNGAATFMTPEALPDSASEIVLDLPEGWKAATALREVEGRTAPTFLADSFDELCDSPFECGSFIDRSFDALGKNHRVVAWNNADARAVDWDAIVRDTRTIVETSARLLSGDEDPKSALPYDRYLFLWHISPRGRGGLEHRASCSLQAKPDRFTSRAGWLDVVSLVAHEFFHLWNIKRIRPEGLFPYRYEEENYTRLLWWFEGGTSYYDWRIPRLAKLATPAEYLIHLADSISKLEDTPGALLHPLEESSFDAWIKAYRPDENSLNSTVSYYLKGEVVCALLDLEIRHRSQGKRSLDDVVRHLWREYGAKEIPVPEAAMPEIFAEVSGVSLDDRFASWIFRADPIDFNEVLAHAGLVFQRSSRDKKMRAQVGARISTEGGRCVVNGIPRGSNTHAAGLDVFDEIVAIDGRRILEGRLDAALAGFDPGAKVEVLVARDGRMTTLQTVLEPAPKNEARIFARPDATREQRALYEAWMEEDFSLAPRSLALK